MTMLNAIATLLLSAGSFFIGVWFADRYNSKAQREKKEALERQYLRLRAHMDADDPCQPYYTPAPQPIGPEFMEQLRKHGKAATKFRKADVSS